MDSIRDDVIKLVQKELESANEKFPLFNSTHEGYAVIKEEVEEAGEELDHMRNDLECIWVGIRKNNADGLDYAKDLKRHAINCAVECIQVAAMAQKFMDSTDVPFED